jgi:hypothetical protein
MRFSAAHLLALWRAHVRFILILILCGLGVVGMLGILKLRWFRHRELAGIMRHEVEATTNVFDRFFSPIGKSFDLLVELGRNGIINLEDRKQLDVLLAALMKNQINHIHQVLIVSSDGQKYEYSRAEEVESPGDAIPFHSLTSTDLEQSPWYRGAMAASRLDEIHWTEPYTFRLTGIPGITGARRYHIEGSERPAFVIAMKISLTNLKTFIRDLRICEGSRILMISGDGVRDFKPLMDSHVASASLESVVVDAAVALQGKDEPLRVRTKGGIWWVAARDSTSRKTPTNIAVVVPESSLLKRTGITFQLLLASYLLVLAMVILAMIMVSRRSQQTLESLAKLAGHTDDSQEQLRSLIRSGESETLEFKSTLRWNLKADRSDKKIELACLKTMVAFMNTECGTLLIGVTDEGVVSGIEADKFPNKDKFLLHFNNLVKEHIGLEFSKLISFTITRLNDASILIVDCARSSEPVFLQHNSEEAFYIRIGPGSRKLSTSKVLNYVRTR